MRCNSPVFVKQKIKVEFNVKLYFRVLYKLSDFEASLLAFKAIQKPDFQSQIGFALSATKAGRFEEAFNAYKASIPMAGNDGERSHVLSAMATIAYKFQVKY